MHRFTPHHARARRLAPVDGLLRAAVAVLVVAALLGAVPAGAEDLETAEQRREEVRQQRAALAAELEVLGADKAALGDALDALQANAVAEQSALVDVTLVAEEARVAAELAAVAVARMDDRLATLARLLRDLAVDAYIGDPGAVGDLAMFVSSSDIGDAAKAVFLVDLEVERQDAIAADLTETKADLEDARVAADEAAAHAAGVRDEVAVRVASAEQARDQQAQFVVAVEAELERRLSEAAGLEQLDEQLAADIVRGEQELAARLAAEAAVELGARNPAPATADRSTMRATPSRPPSGKVVNVRGINVDSTIAEPVEAMLAAAAADGVRLGGGGYRDGDAQVALRAANCGPTDYDRYEKPASQCSPPTARPGHSMHERGLAIDFTYQGRIISSRSSPGFVWLAANAGRFGLRNLPSEPWHWSVNGN